MITSTSLMLIIFLLNIPENENNIKIVYLLTYAHISSRNHKDSNMLLLISQSFLMFVFISICEIVCFSNRKEKKEKENSKEEEKLEMKLLKMEFLVSRAFKCNFGTGFGKKKQFRLRNHLGIDH